MIHSYRLEVLRRRYGDHVVEQIVAGDLFSDFLEIDDLGIYEGFDDNYRRAEKRGLPSCRHCGRGIDLETAWAFRYVPWQQGAIDPTATADLQDVGVETEWAIVGATCGRRILPRKFLVPAREIPNPEEATYR